jgi:thiamine biosynthesis lipoprotein
MQEDKKLNGKPIREVILTSREDGFCLAFFAMASPCEVLIETKDKQLAKKIGKLVSEEVWRIQDKYNRYDINSVCRQLNNSSGISFPIDHETFLLLTFAQQCFDLSEGLFDITSGVLRKVWTFDGGNNLPKQDAVNNLLPLLGWHKVTFNESHITLPKGMEIDFGGIGKEYAVDKAIQMIVRYTKVPALVNLGGDLCATGPRKINQRWQVGIEHPGFTDKKMMVVSLLEGALATSGDAKRYLLKAGKRYSHILNAKTGWPIENAPRSMTVVAPKCIQAGILATLALMQGADAEKYLDQHSIKYWVIR